MVQLEAVYLANVILYVDTIETIIKIIQVNKKCQEATKIIRYYETRKLYEFGECEYNYVVPNNLFDLFPNVETIECWHNDIRNNLELFKKIKQIEIVTYGSDKMELPQEIKDKVIKMDIYCGSLKNIHLIDYPNVKKVKIKYFDNGNLKEFLGDNKLRLNQFNIQTSNKTEIDCLKEYKNIENIIIKVEYEISKERYLQLTSFANVYSKHPIDGIDIKDSFGFFGYYLISNGCDINRLYDLTLFDSCYVESDCDLRYCKSLEEIEITYAYDNQSSIQIEGLKELKRIKNIKKVDCIPSCVTYLSFSQCFNYKGLLEKDMNCFNNIKEVKLESNWKNSFDSDVLMNFKKCTQIEIGNFGNSKTMFEIPEQVKEIIINNCKSENQIEEIKKVNGLKKLTIDINLIEKNEEIQGMYDSLKELEWLTTNYVEKIKLPSTLTFLDLNVRSDNIDLSQYTNLLEIKIKQYEPDDKEIKIPIKLNKLYISGNVIVVNSNEVEVDKLILNNTPSQSRIWKSKCVVMKKYENV